MKDFFDQYPFGNVNNFNNYLDIFDDEQQDDSLELCYILSDLDIYCGGTKYCNINTEKVKKYRNQYIMAKIKTSTIYCEVLNINDDPKVAIINGLYNFTNDDYKYVKNLVDYVPLELIDEYCKLYQSIKKPIKCRDIKCNDKFFRQHINEVMKYYRRKQVAYLPNGRKVDKDLFLEIENRLSSKNTQNDKYLRYLFFYDDIDKLVFKHKAEAMEKYLMDKSPIFSKEIIQFIHHIYKPHANIMFSGKYLEDKLDLVRYFAKEEELPLIEINLSAMKDGGDINGHNPTYNNAQVGRIFEEVEKHKTNKAIFIFRALDELASSNNMNGSLSSAVDDMIHDRAIEDNFIRARFSLENAIFIGTCRDPKRINSHTISLFNVINSDDGDDKIYVLINRYLTDVLKDKKIIFTREARMAICKYAKTDASNKRYQSLIDSCLNYYKASKRVIDEKEVEQVFDLFYANNDLENKFIKNYDKYDDDIRKSIEYLRHSLEKNLDQKERMTIDRQLEYLVACHASDFKEAIDLNALKDYLDATHVGLYDLKYDLLSIIKALSENKKCQNLLLVSNMPGMGKTSIILDCLEKINYSYVRINCPQISSLQHLYGDSSNPGILLDAIKEADSSSGIILLEEIDKCSHEIAASLLNLCDSKNASFYAPFIESNININANVIFATANDISKMLDSLVNRFKLIEIKHYHFKEKQEIIRRYNLGLSEAKIEEYLYMHPFASIRELEIDMHNLYNRALLSDKDINKLIDAKIEMKDKLQDGTYAIAASENFGFISHIECIINQKEDKIIGNVDKVIEEAFSVVLFNLRKNKVLRSYEYVYLNIEGYDEKKTGSSLGLALYAVVLAKVNNYKIGDAAFSGYINLDGKVKMVGMINNKLRAAKAEGIRTVYISKENYQEVLNYIDDYKDLEIIPIENLEELNNKIKEKSHLEK